MKYGNILYRILGILFASAFFFLGISMGSYLGDKMAEIRGVSYESYTAGITVLLFMVFLLPIGYLIYKKLIGNDILGRYFLGTLIILDGLYILFLLFYLSL